MCKSPYVRLRNATVAYLRISELRHTLQSLQFPSLLPSSLLLPVVLAAGILSLPTQAIAQSSVVIANCVLLNGDTTRFVYAGATCKPTEQYVSWNQQGVAGAAGAQGLPGLGGPIGLTGAAGLTGSAGATGATGAQGLPGSIGQPGIPGTAGAAGAIGLTGTQGIAGAAGPQGATGSPGTAGPTGTAGQPGTAGIQGAAGASGPAGPVGSTGLTGPAGSAATIPANLTVLSGMLSSSGYTNSGFGDAGGNSCTIGDIILSVNSYSLGGNAAAADGTILQISQYAALFSLLGTRFGGNGTSTFALPNLKAATPSGLQYSICVLGYYPSRG